MNKTASVLAGGGSRGSYELGVWQALSEINIHINTVTEISISTITNPLKETLQAFLDEEKVRSSCIDYVLVTIEKDTNTLSELFINDISERRMIDYIIASASTYPAFKPYTIDNLHMYMVLIMITSL